MNPHFFFACTTPSTCGAGRKDTANSGCEVHDGRVGEDSVAGVQLFYGARFLWTPTTSLFEPKHFVLVQEELDVKTFQAVR